MNIFLLGDTGVGKTCLVDRFSSNHFTTHTQPTACFDITVKSFEDATPAKKWMIWDTSGHPRFRKSIESRLVDAQGVLLVFDTTSQISFEQLSTEWFPLLKKLGIEPGSMALVGTKCEITKQRQVQHDTAKHMAERHGFAYWEVSAADPGAGSDIDLLFWTLVSEASKKYLYRPAAAAEEKDEEEEESEESEVTGGCCCCCLFVRSRINKTTKTASNAQKRLNK